MRRTDVAAKRERGAHAACERRRVPESEVESLSCKRMYDMRGVADERRPVTDVLLRVPETQREGRDGSRLDARDQRRERVDAVGRYADACVLGIDGGGRVR